MAPEQTFLAVFLQRLIIVVLQIRRRLGLHLRTVLVTQIRLGAGLHRVVQRRVQIRLPRTVRQTVLAIRRQVFFITVLQWRLVVLAQTRVVSVRHLRTRTGLHVLP